MGEQNHKEIVALKLTKEAKTNALKEYHSTYSKKNIQDEVFLTILEKSYILSLEKIEERQIKTKFIILSEDIKNLDWPKGVTFVKFESQKLTELTLYDDLKKYIEFASNHNLYLVIYPTLRRKNSKFQLQLFGILVFHKSIQYFVRKFKYWNLTSNVYSKDLGKLFRSIIFTLDNGRVIVSSFNNEFLFCEKGHISSKTEVTDLLFKIMDKDYGNSGLWETFSAEAEDTWIYVENVLKNIIKRISNERHGSTLIFCYSREIETEEYIHPGSIEIEVPLGTILDTHKDLIKNRNQLLKKYKDFEDLIVSLSITDGALIFNDKIELIRAGVIFKVDIKAQGPGGSRHKSAEAFIKATNSCGFVISQDGKLTIIEGRFKPIDK